MDSCLFQVDRNRLNWNRQVNFTLITFGLIYPYLLLLSQRFYLYAPPPTVFFRCLTIQVTLGNFELYLINGSRFFFSFRCPCLRISCLVPTALLFLPLFPLSISLYYSGQGLNLQLHCHQIRKRFNRLGYCLLKLNKRFSSNSLKVTQIVRHPKKA